MARKIIAVFLLWVLLAGLLGGLVFSVVTP